MLFSVAHGQMFFHGSLHLNAAVHGFSMCHWTQVQQITTMQGELKSSLVASLNSNFYFFEVILETDTTHET